MPRATRRTCLTLLTALLLAPPTAVHAVDAPKVAATVQTDTYAQDGAAIDGAVIYDHSPSTQLGGRVFGTIVADMMHDRPGRCSHGGPVCLEYANGVIAAFYANTSDHNIDGWTEYALSRDGRTWGEQRAAAVDKRIRDPELAYLGGLYYLHGRSGHQWGGAHRFVLYTSKDGEHWSEGIVVSSDKRGPDGYSHNCIVRKYDRSVPSELMVLYSIVYDGRDTNEYVFFVRPEAEAPNE